MIYIYSEKNATYPECVEAVIDRLHDYGVSSEAIVQLDARGLAAALQEEKGILIIPGGHTFYIYKAWQNADPTLVKKVAAAVEKGWNCLGFCAGANLLCDEFVVHMPGYPGASNSGFVGVLPITAHGPAFPAEEGFTDHGRVVSLRTPDGVQFNTYWNDGSYFHNKDWFFPAPILAYYNKGKPDSKSAALTALCGQGKVTACGPHPEFPLENETLNNQKLRTQFLWNLFASVGIHKDIKE